MTTEEKHVFELMKRGEHVAGSLLEPVFSKAHIPTMMEDFFVLRVASTKLLALLALNAESSLNESADDILELYIDTLRIELQDLHRRNKNGELKERVIFGDKFQEVH